jgi:hypothetical protein
MFRTTVLAAAVAAAASVAASEEIRLDAPRTGLSLHAGGIDMVVYYLDEGETFQVQAAYAPRRDAARQRRLRMHLSDGDSLTLGLPGQPHVAYSFARTGDRVTVGAELVVTTIAALE